LTGRHGRANHLNIKRVYILGTRRMHVHLLQRDTASSKLTDAMLETNWREAPFSRRSGVPDYLHRSPGSPSTTSFIPETKVAEREHAKR
jgi:hypothetical protein